jgi:hypothetical protein
MTGKKSDPAFICLVVGEIKPVFQEYKYDNKDFFHVLSLAGVNFPLTEYGCQNDQKS